VTTDTTPIYIPEITAEDDAMSAAIKYAKAGLYVVPVKSHTKHPGSVLGDGWQMKSTRDVQEIVALWAGTDHGVGIHAGRSGLVIFDIDHPEVLPEALQRAAVEEAPPFQQTRRGQLNRGHLIFRVPPGRVLGNGRGQLYDSGQEPGERRITWGEVRGLNGFVMAEPSPHPDDAGEYHWYSDGQVPLLPSYVDALLPQGAERDAPASDDMIAAFKAEHVDNYKLGALDPVLERFARAVKDGASRHEALVEAACWAMREARKGFYPAALAIDTLQGMFMEAMAERPTPGRHPASEFSGVVAWAIGQAINDDSLVAPPGSGVLDPADPVAAIEALVRAEAPRAPNAEMEVTSASAPEPEVAVDSVTLGPVRDPGDYFLDKAAGVDVRMLSDDVLRLGPLAFGRDHNFWAYRAGVWRCEPDVVEGRATRLLQGRFRGSIVTNVEAYTRHRVPRLDFDPTPAIMNWRNGLLDWKTGVLSAHSPEARTTIQFPHDWRPEDDCPQFDAFLASIAEPETVELIWEVLGYMLYSGNPLQKAILFVGGGGNGKGTVLRVLSTMLGRSNIASISLDDLNGDRFAPSGLFGKIANIAGDIDATYQESTASFKMLTGEDQYRAQHKYGQPFDFVSWATPIFSANKIPGSSDTSDGYTRRWIVVPFNRKIAETDMIANLSDRLESEIPGIAAKAVVALRRLLERRSFERKGAVAEAFDAFVEDIDRVRAWAKECCTTQEGHTEKSSVVYQSFKRWCEENGMGRMSAPELTERLARIGYPTKKVKGDRQVVNLRVMLLRSGDPMIPGGSW